MKNPYIKWLETPVPQPEIEKLETRLGVKFSEAYIQYIANIAGLKLPIVAAKMANLAIPGYLNAGELPVTEVYNFATLWTQTWYNETIFRSYGQHLLFASTAFPVTIMILPEKSGQCRLSLMDADETLYDLNLTLEQFLLSLSEPE